MLTKQATLLRRGTWAENRRIRDPRGRCSAAWLSLRFYGDGISCLWPVILAQGPFWWCTCCSAKTDASKEISGRLVGHVVSPFDLS